MLSGLSKHKKLLFSIPIKPLEDKCFIILFSLIEILQVLKSFDQFEEKILFKYRIQKKIKEKEKMK